MIAIRTQANHGDTAEIIDMKFDIDDRHQPREEPDTDSSGSQLIDNSDQLRLFYTVIGDNRFLYSIFTQDGFEVPEAAQYFLWNGCVNFTPSAGINSTGYPERRVLANNMVGDALRFLI